MPPVSSLIECSVAQDVSQYKCPYPNCTTSGGFKFETLYLISQNIAACGNDWRLFDTKTLNQEGCEQLVGSNDFFLYPGADIWARLTTWKFPLLQLVAIFPRPPLSLASEAFVIVHLLGNPAGTLKNLLLKVASCQHRAVFWSYGFETNLKPLLDDDDLFSQAVDTTRMWKALAMIIDSYDEWGHEKGNEARDILWCQLTSNNINIKEKRQLMKICQKTANALAADRSTKFLPIIVAQAFFIGTVALAFGRTPDAASGPSPPTYINIEAHSIAFSALYFWIIPIVFLGSIIGVSQTENAIPRILRRFQLDIDRELGHLQIEMPNTHLFENKVEVPATSMRERNGGIYSWVPEKARRKLIEQIRDAESHLGSSTPSSSKTIDPAEKRLTWPTYLSKVLRLRPGSVPFTLLIVLSCLFTGCLISILVPPIGFICRSQTETAIVGIWLLAAVLDYVTWSGNDDRQFWFMFSKDLLSTLITMGTIVATQVGIFNRCSCYSIAGKVGLALPEISTISQNLFHDIKTVYPAIAFLGIGFQLVVFPAMITRQYHMAMKVFLQRDDDESNLRGWHSMINFFRHVFSAIGGKTSTLLAKLKLPRSWNSSTRNTTRHDSGVADKLTTDP